MLHGLLHMASGVVFILKTF